MTIQNMQSEHDDANNVQHVDEALVEQQHASETSVEENASSSDAVPPITEVSHDYTNSTTSSIPVEASAPQVHEQVAVVEAANTSASTSDASASTASHEEETQPVVHETTHAAANAEPPVAQTTAPTAMGAAEGTEPTATLEPEQTAATTVDAAAAPVFVEESAIAVTEITPSLEPDEDAPRPFTAFLAEFQQAQAQAEAQAEAHLSASLQESRAETFAEFAAPTADIAAPDQPVTVHDVLPPVDFGEGSAFIPSLDGVPIVSIADVTTQAPTEVVEQEQRVAAVADTNEVESIPTPATQRIERPVSPLLRPAQRLRLPRHGATRHRDEAPVAPTSETVETAPAQDVTPVAEPAAETPKPARRYRFDRPAKAQPAVSKPVQTPTMPIPASISTPVTAPVSNNGIVLTPPPATQPTPTFARVEEIAKPEPKTPTVSTPATAPAATVGTPIPEQQSGESVSMENTSTIVAPAEHGRRRHTPERHREKEQVVVAPPVVAPASVADIAVALTTESNTEAVAPEDLPPLEYADLQKANSRRRRRHRTPTAKELAASQQALQTPPVVAPIAPAPIAPVVTPPPAAIAPVVPVRVPTPTPALEAQANPYTIVSGYTVGQMNQGNEASGPFMGPEPSPARGSVNTTRDGRSVRMESQPLRTAPYPVVTTATGGQPSLPAASMNHFANIVSQAIQTQTDRMVVELRRANQAPTNVSVTLPPFPSTERVGVFVDVANLLYSARTQRIAIDFGKLLDFLRGNRRLIRAHAYCPTSPQPGDEQMFLTAVKGLGYRITTKNYKTFASGAKKADLDLDLCMDVVRIVDGGAVDCIVLVSGDSDFMPMLDYCSDHGVRVEVAAFDEAMSATLRQSCDLFVNLSMLEEIRA